VPIAFVFVACNSTRSCYDYTTQVRCTVALVMLNDSAVDLGGLIQHLTP
jgi:hypothetical protein